MADGLLNLGRGTAIRIQSRELAILWEALAQAFADLLMPQDAASWRPRVGGAWGTAAALSAAPLGFAAVPACHLPGPRSICASRSVLRPVCSQRDEPWREIPEVVISMRRVGMRGNFLSNPPFENIVYVVEFGWPKLC
ncbi:hypothetical protein [Novosphingobium sp.]|uniref:hypothetical protein n=1 Tax=Novosphingobium sp. TaxID=1874826 RepID=UPI0031E203DD